MRNIIIGFATPTKFKVGAALIRWWINKPYSHVFVKYQDDQGRAMVFQASHGIVHLCSQERFLSDNTIIKTYNTNISEVEYQQFRDFYYDKLGESYAYLDIAIIMMYDILTKAINIKSVPDAPGYVCSSLIASMLYNIKGISCNKPLHLIRPDDIDMLLYNRSIL